MKLVEFSVRNYRSITDAHEIKLHDLTVLVGKNNEGKSNLLRALNVAMRIVMIHSSSGSVDRRLYEWDNDFPIQLQNRKQGLQSIFKLYFKLEENELELFHKETRTNGNNNIQISIKIGKDNIPNITIPKRGSSSYTEKSKKVTKFISEHITFNYIQAIRTEGMAIRTLLDLIYSEIDSLTSNPDYIEAQQTILNLQNDKLNSLGDQLLEPLKNFLPNIKGVSFKIKSPEYLFGEIISKNTPSLFRNEIDMIIDDGTPTSISTKGDGIKSLVTLAILKERKSINGVSVIAIEEPESHLHSGAIHNLVEVINNISQNNQVIISTHNPLFVQRNQLNCNIIVDNGKAKAAKNISEIREVLGVWISDNLKSAKYVLLVEGEDDKISLTKILSYYSEKIDKALKTNMLVIKALGGTGNLSHDANDLNNSMCRYIVLLDNDKAGIDAANKAISKGLLKDSDIRFTICNGSPEAEFEDCLNPRLYASIIKDKYSIDILNEPNFKGNKKWSEKMKDVFLSKGLRWSEKLEQEIKYLVANSVPVTTLNIGNVLIEQKSGFIKGLVSALENLIEEKC